MTSESAASPIVERFEIDGIAPDFTLSVGGSQKAVFVAHRAVLALVSKVFAAMFKSSQGDKNDVVFCLAFSGCFRPANVLVLQTPLDLPADAPDAFRLLLKWAYRTEDFNLSLLKPTQLDAFLVLADKYDVPRLTAEVVERLERELPKGFCLVFNYEIYYVAVKHHLHVAKNADEFITSLSLATFNEVITKITLLDPVVALRLEKLRRTKIETAIKQTLLDLGPKANQAAVAPAAPTGFAAFGSSSLDTSPRGIVQRHLSIFVN